MTNYDERPYQTAFDYDTALYQLAQAQQKAALLADELAAMRASFEDEVKPLKMALLRAQEDERDMRLVVDNLALDMYAAGEKPPRVTVRTVRKPMVTDEAALVRELMARDDLRHLLKVTVNQTELRRALEAGAELDNAALVLERQTAIGKLGDLLLETRE